MEQRDGADVLIPQQFEGRVDVPENPEYDPRIQLIEQSDERGKNIRIEFSSVRRGKNERPSSLSASPAFSLPKIAMTAAARFAGSSIDVKPGYFPKQGRTRTPSKPTSPAKIWDDAMADVIVVDKRQPNGI
jgi:hypothetical protein